MEECIHQEILDSIKNASGMSSCPHCQRQSRDGRLAKACRSDPQAEFTATHHATYKQFITMQ